MVHGYPIPFGRADCRQALYHVLLCCLVTDLPNVSSPVNHAVRLFSYGLQDADLGVKGVRVIPRKGVARDTTQAFVFIGGQ